MKLLLNLCMLLISGSLMSSNLFGQTNKNQLLIGGQYGLNFSSMNSTYKGVNSSYLRNKTRYLQIGPQIGYFIFNNTSAGLEFNYQNNKEFPGDNNVLCLSPLNHRTKL